jgi:hypothetical protein
MTFLSLCGNTSGGMGEKQDPMIRNASGLKTLKLKIMKPFYRGVLVHQARGETMTVWREICKITESFSLQ